MSPLGYKNVGRFDVAVHNASTMGGIERIGDFDGQRKNGFAVDRTSAYPVLERDAIQKLHDKKGLTVLLPNLVNRADIRMIQGRGGTCFTAETLQGLWTLGNVNRKELQCDEPPSSVSSAL